MEIVTLFAVLERECGISERCEMMINIVETEALCESGVIALSASQIMLFQWTLVLICMNRTVVRINLFSPLSPPPLIVSLYTVSLSFVHIQRVLFQNKIYLPTSEN